MRARWTRFVAASALAVAVAGTGLFAATPASAATPIVVGSCATTVQGAPGTPVELSPAAVAQPLVNIVNAVSLGLLGAPFQSAFDALPPIPIGAVPTGTGYITGGQIANAVVAAIKPIPLLGPILGTVVADVQNTLSTGCGVTVQGVNAAVAPVQDGTQTLSNLGTQAGQSLGLPAHSTNPGNPSGPGAGQTPPGNPSGPGGADQGGQGQAGQGMGSNMPVTSFPGLGGADLMNNPAFGAAQLLNDGLAESPLARYSGIPFASAGLFAPSPGVRYGGDVPGYGPGYGVLGNNGNSVPDGIQTAGEAQALGSGSLPGGNGIGLPMLLAVLTLSGATAGLVRTWVLRKVRPL